MTLFIVSLIAGALTVLAPCVLPLLPVILAGSVAEAQNTRRPLVIILSLAASVFAFTLLLKGSTALIDVSPSFWTYVSGAILAAFGLTLIFPAAWARLVLKIPGHGKPDRWITKGYGTASSLGTDIIVGAALGPVFTTCSPTFFVILATVLPQSLGIGIIDLLAYILGLSVMLLLIAHIGQRLVNRLEWATDPQGWFRRGLGILFVILAVLIIFGWDKKIEAAILNAGFFDVTKLEQSIQQSLEKGRPAGGSGGAVQTTGGGGIGTPEHDRYPEYTDIVRPAGFINSQPFTLADLIGKKVILVDFIDYTCINCQRTFPYLNDWYEKYKDQGLEIVAIHTPEFSFEKKIENVRTAAQQFGLAFPIVLDNEYATWNAYKNNAWPHKYLIDISGKVVFEHIGEGAYDETEKKIVQLLNERKQILGEEGTVVQGSPMPAYSVRTQSPETYFGALRNEYFGNGRSFAVGEDTFKIPAALQPNAFYLGGGWKVDQEYIENTSSSAQLSFVFTSADVYIVAESADGTPIEAQVLIDGKPISAADSGADVVDGKVQIGSSRLYRLYKGADLGRHRLDLIFLKKGVRAYTFTFG